MRRRGTVRLRLTAVHTGLFVATSAILVLTVNLLLQTMLHQRVAGMKIAEAAPPTFAGPPSGSPMTGAVMGDVADLPDAVLRYQWTVSGVTIAALTLVSIAAGWWLSGRLLRPLHRITATARRLSVSTLHERIALAGPRDELTELADTFDTMLGRLQSAVDSQRRFVANASHELRTPLAIQRAAIQIGLDDPTPQRLDEIRRELLLANHRAERLIEGLLVLAQSEHGLETSEPVALDAVVRQAVGETPGEGIAVTLATEPVQVAGDPVLLHRLVANLVHNAVRHNRSGGTVEVRLASTGDLTVRNTGPEVPADRVDELFEPFRRLRAARTGPSDGAGLGLSIVAAIARAHDAAVTARPNPGGGLELTVRFRARQATSGAESRPVMI
ncbi:sensor histidine kinase [Solihabitans fulvus]|uniref:sensor histidine kinase n=1 Tax=Solihabitans fulvus TaxID=1892852 RepID=UPI001CB76514|nr:ATP-binding protein [Solihabitans fulvus]